MQPKKCLILADGPVPTPEHKQVEGGGLRCWGLAKGILANNKNIEVTVAYHGRFKTADFTDFYEGVHIATYHDAATAIELASQHDTILLNYALGDLPVVLAEAINPDQQLILDCNVPAYVEVSARNSADIQKEFEFFHEDVNRFARALRRGDIFLCASDAQQRYYQGVLSAIGRVNPVTYGSDLIYQVPYGIYRDAPVAKTKPITDLMKKGRKAKKLLWFGGIYPWFDLTTLVDAVQIINKTTPTELVIVGAKNPFNGHPDFIKRYDDLMAYLKDEGRSEFVTVKDWVDFNDRGDWYLDSDLVVTLNKIGEENELAWRTRLVDYVWADLPIVTNGGDPLGERLIQKGAAVRLSGLDAKDIAKDIETIFKDEKKLQAMKRELTATRKELYWDVVTNRLAEAIENHWRAPDIELMQSFNPVAPSAHVGKARRIISKARQLPAYTKKYGARNTYFTIRTLVKNKVGNRIKSKLPVKPAAPRTVVISHQLDLSGAPFVLIDLVRELKRLDPKHRIEFNTYNPTHPDQILALNKMGIKPNIYMAKDAIPILNPGDSVIINTIAHSPIVKDALYSKLEDGTLKKLLWYIHEDNPEYLFTDLEISRIKKLIDQDKIVLFTAAAQTKEHYDSYFSTSKTRLQPYKVVTPEKYHKVREAKDFDKLTFSLTGVAADSRKGQLSIFYAFVYFLNTYFKKNPDKYREFELVYVGLGHDMASTQIKNHAEKGLGKRFTYYGILPKEEMLDLTAKANITICYSLVECLPLFVFEGMITGHPILRNDSSGFIEQLEPGKNGFVLETKDFMQIVETIEKLLDRKATSNETLAKMSKRSYEIARAQEDNTYISFLKELKG